MSRYKKLKSMITDILLDIPIDLPDEDTGNIFLVQDWESCIVRDFNSEYDLTDAPPTRKIGSFNILEAVTLIDNACNDEIIKLNIDEEHDEEISGALIGIFQDILDELVTEKIIRKSPLSLRDGISLIVDNTK